MKLKSEKINSFLSKKKNIGVIYIIVIIGVGLLSVGSFMPAPKEETKCESVSGDENLEEKIAGILSQMRGVGSASVMVTYQSGTSQITAKDINENVSGADGERQISREEKNIVIGSGSSQKPVIIREEMPKVLGVVVVAEGGNDSKIKSQITDAIKALCGINANNIAVFAKK